MVSSPDSTIVPRAAAGPLRVVGAFVAGTITWLALFTFLLMIYPSSWGYGVTQAVLTALAWCVSTAAGAAVSTLAAHERTRGGGGRSGLVLGFVVAGGGLLYSVTGHRPANSDAWPTDLLIWGIALALAMVSGFAGGWTAGTLLARRS